MLFQKTPEALCKKLFKKISKYKGVLLHSDKKSTTYSRGHQLVIGYEFQLYTDELPRSLEDLNKQTEALANYLKKSGFNVEKTMGRHEPNKDPTQAITYFPKIEIKNEKKLDNDKPFCDFRAHISVYPDETVYFKESGYDGIKLMPPHVSINSDGTRTLRVQVISGYSDFMKDIKRLNDETE
jgi:hypothetical protein